MLNLLVFEVELLDSVIEVVDLALVQSKCVAVVLVLFFYQSDLVLLIIEQISRLHILLPQHINFPIQL